MYRKSEEHRRKLSEALEGKKQTQEHINKRVETRMKNGSYVNLGLGHQPTNTKPNSRSFKEGNIPWNKGKKIPIDLDYCKKKYLEGYSCYEISKKFNVHEATIRNRFREIGFKLRKNTEHPERIIKKIRETMIERNIQPIERYSGEPWNKGIPATPEVVKRLKENRAKQIFPKKDTKIEIKVRKFLEKLQIEYFQHKYMNIKNAYQCDFFIPSLNLVIECDGNYWHKYPTGREIDHIRTKQLMENGFKVLRLWEFEINDMSLNEFKGRLK